MNIGDLKLKNRFFLAPMLEVNDIVFRILCKTAGASLCFTGMINPLSRQKLYLDDKPAIQIFSTKVTGIKDFIKTNESHVSLFDFNLGCPAKTARKLGFGSFMHHDLETIEKILKIMRSSTDLPITVKLRKSKNAFKIAKIASKYCDAISIHPRTQDQGYSGEPDLDFALRIKKEINLPIIYSGNVNEKNYKELLKHFDFLMIGRSAIGNPNIFSTLLGKKTDFSYEDWIKIAENYTLPFRQYKFQAMWFTKGRDGAPRMREKIAKAKTLKDLKEIYGLKSI